MLIQDEISTTPQTRSTKLKRARNANQTRDGNRDSTKFWMTKFKQTPKGNESNRCGSREKRLALYFVVCSNRQALSIEIRVLREMGMGKMTLELAARRSGAGRDEAEGARIALASPDTRPEIAVAVAVAITIGARKARVLLFSPLFLLYYCPSLFVLLFAV